MKLRPWNWNLKESVSEIFEKKRKEEVNPSRKNSY